MFGNPNISNTIDIKSASYDHLINGMIPIGTLVKKGDALIGKIVKLKNERDMLYSDRSIIYKEKEPAIVHNVIKQKDEDDEMFCKVICAK